MRKGLCLFTIGMAASIAGLSAQSTTNNPANVAIIGCLQGAQKTFTLKDYRSGVSYQIDADAETIGWHVGHQLEIQGTLEVRGETRRVKPTQVIYIATKCSPVEPAAK